MTDHRPRKKLPAIGRHTIIGVLAFGAFVVCSEQMEDRFPDIPYRSFIAITSFALFFIYVLFYFFIYPFLHILQRYSGEHTTAWIVWMVVDTIGLTFGLVTLIYYLFHIIPDWFRSKFAKSSRPKTEANKPEISSPISPRVD